MSEENEQPNEETEAEAPEPEAAAPEPEAAAPEGSADAEAPGSDAEAETPEPEAAAAESGAEDESPADAAPEADEGAPTDVAEAAEPDDVEAEEPAPPAEDEAADDAKAEEPAAEKPKDIVPGADLDPIAITEERELSAEERAALEAEEEERAAREAAENADDEDEIPARQAAAVPKDTSIQATGKRKSSVARVLLRDGDGKLEINGREIGDYFPRAAHQTTARQPLVTSGYDGNVNLQIRVHGGGISGQAGAVRHGIARALLELEPELRGELKKRGYLTRDAREKERRKAGLKKARKKPQFSKR